MQVPQQVEQVLNKFKRNQDVGMGSVLVYASSCSLSFS